jgi:hypothetical protein
MRYSLRLLTIAGILLFTLTIYATEAFWHGDFWEHSAVLVAITAQTNLLVHPILQLFAPHAFISPYSFLISEISIVTNLTSIDALALGGIVNFLLLCCGLAFWINSINKSSGSLSTFYALLTILFLWGANPWGYSGFFHYRVIADILPYPSTFALALTLIALSLNAYTAQRNSYLWKPIVFLLFWVVLLTHPLTAIFFAFGLIAQLWCVPKKLVLREVLLNAALGLLAVGAATLWPYYSIIELVLGAGDVYHPENKSMYVDVLSRIWPTLVALPFAAWALKDRRGQSILLLNHDSYADTDRNWFGAT